MKISINGQTVQELLQIHPSVAKNKAKRHLGGFAYVGLLQTKDKWVVVLAIRFNVKV